LRNYVGTLECDEGTYLKTPFGAIFVSSQPSTWIGASDECCARGGYLLLRPDYHLLVIVSQLVGRLPGNKTLWIGAIKSPTSAGAVWCFPGESDIPMRVQDFELLQTEDKKITCYFHACLD
jgi:hypothetical protein